MYGVDRAHRVPAVAVVLATVVLWMLVGGGVARAAGPISWTFPSRVASGAVDSLSCPSRSLCVGVDPSGGLVASASPGVVSNGWRPETVSDPASGAALDLVAVSCPSTALCVAVSSSGAVVTSQDPRAANVPWSVADLGALASPGGGVVLTGVDCPTTSLCVAIDKNGDVVTSTAPTGGVSAWQVSHIDDGETYTCRHYGPTQGPCQPGLVAVSCATPSSCTAVDDSGYAFRSADPAGGPGAWQTEPGPPTSSGYAIFSLACPSTSLCIAGANYDPEILAFGSAVPRAHGEATPDGQAADVTAVWCADAALCFAALSADLSPTSDQFADRLYATTEPTGETMAWKVNDTPPAGASISGLSCPSVALCFAADTYGNLVVGTPMPARSRIRVSIASELTPRGSAARIPVLRRRGRYTFTAAALTAGHLRITWSIVASNKRPRALRRAVIATGAATFPRPGRRRLSIRLTRTGERLLRNVTRISVAVHAVVTPTNDTASSSTAR